MTDIATTLDNVRKIYDLMSGSNNNINIFLALVILYDDIRNIIFLQSFNKNLTVVKIK